MKPHPVLTTAVALLASAASLDAAPVRQAYSIQGVVTGISGIAVETGVQVGDPVTGSVEFVVDSTDCCYWPDDEWYVLGPKSGSMEFRLGDTAFAVSQFVVVVYTNWVTIDIMSFAGAGTLSRDYDMGDLGFTVPDYAGFYPYNLGGSGDLSLLWIREPYYDDGHLSADVTVTPVSVPEPATAGLLALALASAGMTRRLARSCRSNQSLPSRLLQ